MKIDMVSEHASPLAALGGADAGGQNVQVAQLASGLARLGHEVVVHTRRDAEDLPERIQSASGVAVEHVTAGPPWPIPKDELLPYMDEFGDHLARKWALHRPDLVHAHFWMSGLAARRGSAGLGIPVLQTFHALGRVKRRHQGAMDTSPAVREALEASLARKADLVVATCADEVSELNEMGVPPERTTIVPCGIDLDLFTPDGPAAPRSHRPRILSIGRMVERKGLDTAIEALADVPGAELVVVGGPNEATWGLDPEVARLKAVADRSGVGDRVVFHGPVAHGEAPALYRSADVVVSVPWYEPFGTVPVEAMACGTPPLVTSVGGHLDTVVDGVTGVHIPPRDSAELARNLRVLLAAPSRRRQLSRAGIERVRQLYGWDQLARDVETAYLKTLARYQPAVLSRAGGDVL